MWQSTSADSVQLVAAENEEGDFEVVPDKDKTKSYDVEAKSLSVAEVQKGMRSDVEHIVSIFGLDVRLHSLSYSVFWANIDRCSMFHMNQSDSARMLLREYNWNSERLIEKYMDNPTKVQVDAGVQRPVANGPSAPKEPLTPRRSTRKSTLPVVPPSTKFVCPICCDDKPAATISLQCGHQFCDSCWTQYLEGKIHDEGECIIRCMENGCNLLVPDSFVKEHGAPKEYDRFEELVMRHYVSHIPHLKFCPAPGCTDTVSCRAAATRSALETMVPSVTCSHGHAFCFGCNIDSDHRPVLCRVAKLWLKKCQDDSETANWIKTNTKECPKCQSTIEKNGGCK